MNYATALKLASLFFVMVIAFNIAIGISAIGASPEEALRMFTNKRGYTLSTEELRYLDPHNHGAEDKVSDAHHGVNLESSTLTIKEDTWIDTVELDIQNAPEVTLHHLNLFAELPQTPLSPPLTIGMGQRREIMSLGQETPKKISLRKPYGILLPAGTKIVFSTMLHNPNPPKGPGEVYEHVSVNVRLTGSVDDSSRSIPITLKRLVLSDVATEEQEVFIVPPHTEGYVKHSTGSGVYRDSSFTFPAAGTIIRMGSHLHPWEGGERVDAYLNGNHLISFVPRKSGPNGWDWLTDFSEIPIHVKAGDVLTITSTYSNPGDEPIVGAMGMVSFRYALDPISQPAHRPTNTLASLFTDLIRF